MRKLTLARNRLLKQVMLLIALLTMTSGAMAQEMETLTLDKEYTVGMFQSPRYSFTAPETGSIYMYCSSQDYPLIWKDSACTDPYNVEVNPYNNPRWMFDVVAGKTYYIGYGLGFTMDVTTFHITMNGPSGVEAIAVEPDIDSIIAVGYPIGITFSVPVNIDRAVLQGGKAQPVEIGYNLSGSNASFEVKETMYSWMNQGLLKANDEVKLTITGVCSTSDPNLKGGEDGTMTFTWKSAPMPIYLVSQSLPNHLISKWDQGDLAGIAVLEFSGDLAEGASASLTNGDLAKGGTYESVPVTVEGNKLYIDFTGVVRYPAMEFTYVLDVYNVCATDGYPAYSPGAGSVGSYTFTIDFDDEPYIEPAKFDFTPASNSNLQGVGEIVITVGNKTSSFSYTDVTFTYTAGNITSTVTVDYADIVYLDGGLDATITVKVPAEIATADPGSNVTVTLLDGATPVASANYIYGQAPVVEKFNIALVSPRDGSILEKLAADDSILLMVTGIPANCEIEIQGSIEDNTTGDIVKWCFFSPEDGDGYNYRAMMWDDVDLIEGHTYTLYVSADAYALDENGFRGAPEHIDTFKFTYYGAGKEYVYSDVELIGIDPDPATTDITSEDQNVVTVKFSGPVSELRVVEPIGMGAGVKEYEVAKANADGTEWTFTIPALTINTATGTISLNMFALDAEGHPVWRSALFDPLTFTGIYDAMQAKDETCFSLMYKCTVGSPEFSIKPADGSKVESIDSFVLSYSSGINFSWSTSDDIVLYRVAGDVKEEVQRWSGMYFDMWENADKCQIKGDVVVAWTLTLDNTLTTAGEYTLCVPNCFFYLGSEFSQANSKAQTATVTIEAAAQPDKFNIALVSPEDGATLEKLTADQSILLNVTAIPEGCDIEILGTICDDNTGDYIKWCFFYPEEGSDYNYACMMWEDVDLIEGHTYTLAVSADAYALDEDGFRGAPEHIDTFRFTFYGAGKEFVYSDVELIGIDPDPATTDITSVDQNVVTVKFSGPVSEFRVVEPIGMGAGVIYYDSAKANEDGTEWTFTIPDATILNATGSISINMFAVDAQGHPVWKSALFDPATFTGVYDAMQAKDETCFSLMYKCTVGSPEFDVTPADGSKVTSIDSFVLSYPTGINFSWTTSEDIVLYRGEGDEKEEIQRWSGMYFDSWENSEMCEFQDYNVVAWTLALDEVQTQAGVYTLCIPNSFFYLGSEFSQANSKAQTVTVTIDKLDGVEGIATDLNGNDAIYNIAGQKVGSDYKGFVIKNGKKVYIK